jgi:hypothetical protein
LLLSHGEKFSPLAMLEKTGKHTLRLAREQKPSQVRLIEHHMGFYRELAPKSIIPPREGGLQISNI